ncbi:MAG: hypothetical protein WBP56_05705 [Polyangia bacterium]
MLTAIEFPAFCEIASTVHLSWCGPLVTGRRSDVHSLTRSYPYMHDGKTKTLADVVDYLDRGETPNPNLDALVKPLNLTAREKQDLVAFIKALTGSVPKVTPSNCR